MLFYTPVGNVALIQVCITNCGLSLILRRLNWNRNFSTEYHARVHGALAQLEKWDNATPLKNCVLGVVRTLRFFKWLTGD